ncbi:MAG: hypothetical protein ACM3MI_14270 [Clostridiales bacterium]
MKSIILSLLLISTTLFSQSMSLSSAIPNSTILSGTLPINEDQTVKNKQSLPLPSLLVQNVPSKKSGVLAVLYSLVLPGMGELYAGSYGTGKYFTAAEGVIWGVFIGYNVYGNWQKGNYKAFASSYGGVNSAGKDADFYANMGDYVSVEEFNRQKGLNGEFDKLYNTQQYYWNWKTESKQKEYRNMWVSSEQSYNNIRFAVGALIVNRIVSAFNAARLVRSYNKSIENVQTGWNLSVGFDPAPNAPSNMSLNFNTSF